MGWVKFVVAENESHIYPNMCAKFGCGPTVVPQTVNTNVGHKHLVWLAIVRCWHVSSPFCDEHRACETFKNYSQHYVISRHAWRRGVFIVFFGTPFLFLESPWDGVGQLFYVRESPVSIRICVTNLVEVRRSCRKKRGYRQTDKGDSHFHQYYVLIVTLNII